MWKQVPNEATFSRAFAEFAQAKLAEHVHEALVKSYLGDTLIAISTAMARRSKRERNRRANYRWQQKTRARKCAEAVSKKTKSAR
jgi:hypothetical protein